MRAKILTFKRARRLRKGMSLPEVVLWDHLRQGKLNDLRFRRQHPMGAHMLDFYCPSTRLAGEIDGEGHSHPDQARHDHSRGRWLESQGVRMLRFAAAGVLDDEALPSVLGEIAAVAAPSTAEPVLGPACGRSRGRSPSPASG